MEKNYKILILLIVIIVVAIGSYITYEWYMNTNFENNLKYANEYANERVDNQNEFSADSETIFTSQKEGSRIITDIIKKIDKTIKSTNNEITKLEEAKNYAKTLEEAKYIDLQLKIKNNYKDRYELMKKWCEYRVKEIQIGMFSTKYANEENETMNKAEKLNNESEKDIKEIANLLKENPDLKQKLENLHLKDSYIGEANYS